MKLYEVTRMKTTAEQSGTIQAEDKENAINIAKVMNDWGIPEDFNEEYEVEETYNDE